MPPRTQKRATFKKVTEPGAAASPTPHISDVPQPQDVNTPPQPPKQNDDLKKLIDTLKNKIGTNTNSPTQKKSPPPPKNRARWNRSIKDWAPESAYTVLTRISNHEKVPVKTLKPSDHTIKSLPHSFLYKPGADGIKVDKVEVKAGKQVGWG